MTSKRHQNQGGKHHPIHGNDQWWRVAELDENGSGGNCDDSDGKKYIKTIHFDKLIAIQKDLQGGVLGRRFLGYAPCTPCPP